MDPSQRSGLRKDLGTWVAGWRALLDLGEVEDMPVKRDDPWDESANEGERYSSFDNSSIDQKTRSVIAKLGFIYIGNKNMAECLYCGIVREIKKGIGATHASFILSLQAKYMQ